MNEQRNQPTASDEFDVEVLAEKLYRVASCALAKLVSPFVTLLRKPLISLAWLVSGLVLSYGLTRILPATYEVNFLLKPAQSTDLVFIGMLNEILELSNDEDYVRLSEQLGLSEEILQDIKQIAPDVLWSGEGQDSAIYTVIHIKAKNNLHFDTVQAAVVNYLENSTYYARLRSMRIDRDEALIAKLEAEIAELDSLKGIMQRQIAPQGSGAGGFVYGEAPDVIRVYETGLSFYVKQLEIMESRKFPQNFEVVKPIVVSDVPDFPRLLTLLLYIMPAVFIGAVVHIRRTS